MKKFDFLISFFTGILVSLLFFSFLRNFKIKNPFILTLNFLFFPLAFVFGLFICQILAKKFLIFLQIGKYVISGTLATLCDIFIFKIERFIFPFETQIFINIYKAISFLGATFFKFFLNKFWVFEKREKEKMAKEITLFYFVTIFVYMLVNVFFFWLFTFKILIPLGIEQKTAETFSIVLAALFSWILNFLGYKFLVFKK